VETFRRRVFTGLLTLVPLLITLWVMGFVLDVVMRVGRPLVRALSAGLAPRFPEAARLLMEPWFQSGLAIIIIIVVLWAVGVLTNVVIGRRLLRSFDRVVETVPLARTVYGASRSLIDSFNKQSPMGKRVVLIEFPSRDMRAVGFVTATFMAQDTGEEVAAVYVPTTPNPTSGYVEIVPIKRLVWLDWSTNDAMSFIVSGGAVAPASIRMHPNGQIEPPPPPEAGAGWAAKAADPAGAATDSPRA